MCIYTIQHVTHHRVLRKERPLLPKLLQLIYDNPMEPKVAMELNQFVFYHYEAFVNASAQE